MFSLALRFVLVFFSPFSIAITSLGEERADLCAHRAFVLRVLVCVSFPFLIVSGIDCDLLLWHSLDFSFSCYKTKITYKLYKPIPSYAITSFFSQPFVVGTGYQKRQKFLIAPYRSKTN